MPQPENGGPNAPERIYPLELLERLGTAQGLADLSFCPSIRAKGSFEGPEKEGKGEGKEGTSYSGSGK